MFQGACALFISVGHPSVDAEGFNKILVVVLGMHRSGTSSAAGALVHLGAAAPQHLMAPNADNERGFWESPVILDLNNAVLAAGGSDWRDWRKFNFAKICKVEADALRARAKEALAEEFGDVGFAVMKDPRMCRLMPFWGQVFAEARWSVRVLLPIRSPLEVSQSLTCRDGLSPSYGCLLWLRHVLDAEVETRGMARAVLDWPEFLGDRHKALARVSEQWDLIWPHWHEDALSEVDGFISADLRRQRTSEAELAAHPAVHDLVRRTYAAMIELVLDSKDGSVLKKLDDLRAGFETASAIFDVPMRESAEEVHRVRSEAAVEIARVQDIMDRGKRKSRNSTRAGSRFFWKPHSKDLEAIRNSLFFNSAHYLKTNPDVRATGLDAALHYLVHGGREGRDPGPFFSTKAYLARYPDVAEADLNALLHYETQGRRENRIAVA
ncbi:MAG TPA: hypothetical protein VIZ19_12955 [Roseiarcus sp.]